MNLRWARRRLRRLPRRAVRAAAGVAVVGVVGLGVANAGSDDGRPSRGALCASVRQAADRLGHEHPEIGVDRMRAAAEQACDNGFPHVEVATPAATPRPAPARAGARASAFVARRAGALPGSGTATVGGVRLPAGRRMGHVWVTDTAVPDAPALAGRLAETFRRTGLWPVLWDAAPDRPEDYGPADGSGSAAAGLDAARVLADVWNGYADARGPFPGLAPHIPRARLTGRLAFDVAAASGSFAAPGAQLLVLVPVTRPADAVAVLGLVRSEILSDVAIAAVLRSWEDRFGAVLTTAGPGTVGLAVGAPPDSAEQALGLAAEVQTLAPEQDTDAVEDRAEALLRGEPGLGASFSRNFWALGWPD